jgi:hypothetical protein
MNAHSSSARILDSDTVLWVPALNKIRPALNEICPALNEVVGMTP